MGIVLGLVIVAACAAAAGALVVMAASVGGHGAIRRPDRGRHGGPAGRSDPGERPVGADNRER